MRTYRKLKPTGFFIDKTLLILFVFIFIFIVYLFHLHIWNMEKQIKKPANVGINPSIYLLPRPAESKPKIVSNQLPIIGNVSSRYDVLSDPYIPPKKVDGYIYDGASSDIRGLPPIVAPIQRPISTSYTQNFDLALPVNVETRGVNSQYSQVGILTKTSFSENKPKRLRCRGEDCDNDQDNSNIESKLILPLMGRRHISGRDKWQYYTISNSGNINTKLPIRVNGRSCTSEYGCTEIMNGDIVHVEGYNHKFKATIYENSLFDYIPVL